MGIRLILSWLQAISQNLEWTTSDGRTFQVSGDPRMAGCFERFVAGDHPSRRSVGLAEAQEQFDSAESFVLYSFRKDEQGAERLTREQVLERIEQMFPGSLRRA